MIKGKDEVVPVFNYSSHHKDVWGNGGIFAFIINLLRLN
jgi:hypothetical protein